jgi:hypothetical protein
MREIKTEIQIAASPAKVWTILTDFDHWKDWNPIVKQVSGAAAVGSQLRVTMCGKEGSAGHTYMPVITDLEGPKSFRWRAKMMAGFLFTNDKVFELKEVKGGTQLVHKELFGGLMVPLFWSKMTPAVPNMLESMNKALKKKAEGS